MNKIRKIAELAFHGGTGETEAVAAFLALRRCGLAELKDALSVGESTEQISSWTIAGPDSYITRATFCGCTIAEMIDGKCHVIRNKKLTRFSKQKFTIILKYSTKYSSITIEEQFEKLLKN